MYVEVPYTKEPCNPTNKKKFLWVNVMLLKTYTYIFRNMVQAKTSSRVAPHAILIIAFAKA